MDLAVEHWSFYPIGTDLVFISDCHSLPFHLVLSQGWTVEEDFPTKNIQGLNISKKYFGIL